MTLFSLAGSLDHANRTAQPESGSERKMNAIYGPKCLEQYGKFNHVGSWAKMFSALLIGTGDWYSRRCKLTWKLKGTKYNRLYFQLQASAIAPTNGTEFGLWPTPTMMEDRRIPNGSERDKKLKSNMNQYTYVLLLPTPKVGGKEGYETRSNRQGHDKAITHLEAFVEYHMLPTPTTRDYKGARSTEALENSGRNHTNSLPDSFSQPGTTSQLNPRFVLEMMGFPPNWTELPFLSGETNQ